MIHRRNVIFAGVALALITVGLVLFLKRPEERTAMQAVVLNVPPPVSEVHDPHTVAATITSDTKAEGGSAEHEGDASSSPGEHHTPAQTRDHAVSSEEPSAVEPHGVEPRVAEQTESAPAEQAVAAHAVHDAAEHEHAQTESPTTESADLSVDKTAAVPEPHHVEPGAGDSPSRGDHSSPEMSDVVASSTELVVTRGVNLRSKPSTASNVLAIVPVGERLQRRHQEVELGYYRVAWGEREGWVWQRNVADAKPTPADSDAEHAGVETQEAPAETVHGEDNSIAEAAVTHDTPVSASEPRAGGPAAEEEVASDHHVADHDKTPSDSPGSDQHVTLDQPAEAQPNHHKDSQVVVAEEAAQETEVQVNDGKAVPAIVSMNVNMRAEPTKESRILITLRKGKEVLKLENEPVRGYFLVEYGDLKGWVWRRAIDLQHLPDTAEAH